MIGVLQGLSKSPYLFSVRQMKILWGYVAEGEISEDREGQEDVLRQWKC